MESSRKLTMLPGNVGVTLGMQDAVARRTAGIIPKPHRTFRTKTDLAHKSLSSS